MTHYDKITIEGLERELTNTMNHIFDAEKELKALVEEKKHHKKDSPKEKDLSRRIGLKIRQVQSLRADEKRIRDELDQLVSPPSLDPSNFER